MKELKLLNQFPRVKAPPDFEEKLWERYQARQAKQARKKRLTIILGGSLATAAAALWLVFWLVSPSPQAVQRVSPERPGSVEKFSWPSSTSKVVPLTEPVLYTHEFSSWPQQTTIYILEPIAATPGRPIMY
ncbi:MAG: hypothetical protein J7L26_11580 [Candidatus Aminicenantes bacterium]|nr:hypothetical protein [Candidatus Aminicenantes bacterium]